MDLRIYGLWIADCGLTTDDIRDKKVNQFVTVESENAKAEVDVLASKRQDTRCKMQVAVMYDAADS